MKKRCFPVAALCALLVFLCFFCAENVQRCYPALSLRWQTPLTPQQAQALRTAALEQEDAPLYPTFWREEQGQAAASLHQADQVTAICFNGEGALCYPARFVTGGYPGSQDPEGCALSTALAWQLFGSNDIVGQIVDWQGTCLTVRGVFEEDACMLLRGTTLTDSFTAVELSGSFADDRRAQAQELIRLAGLGEPDSMVYGSSMATAATALCFVPLVTAGMLLAAGWVRRVRKLPAAHRQVLLFAGALGAALCLPLLLNALPGWVIPARWSDFSFWPQLGRDLLERLDEWFALLPARKDVLAKRALALLGVCSAAASCLTVVWYNKTRV